MNIAQCKQNLRPLQLQIDAHSDTVCLCTCVIPLQPYGVCVCVCLHVSIHCRTSQNTSMLGYRKTKAYENCTSCYIMPNSKKPHSLKDSISKGIQNAGKRVPFQWLLDLFHCRLLQCLAIANTTDLFFVTMFCLYSKLLQQTQTDTTHTRVFYLVLLARAWCGLR